MKHFWTVLILSVLFLPGAFGKEQRIVSLSPGVTEIIFLIGGEKSLVGRSTACDWPAAAKGIPVAGDFAVPFPERILLAKPDWVVSTNFFGDAAMRMLAENNIRTKETRLESFSDYRKVLLELGVMTGMEHNAGLEVKKLDTTLEDFRKKAQKIPEGKRPKVLILISVNPLVTAGRTSYLDEFIRLAGGINAAGKSNKSYFVCSPEYLAMNPPDVIVLCGHGGMLEKIPSVLPDSPALRNGKIFRDLEESLIYRLGPRTFDGIRRLREYLFPERTSEKAPNSAKPSRTSKI